MAQIEINCIGQTAIYTNTPEIFSGDVNIDTVKFTFDEVWDGYDMKTAVFYNNPKDTYPVMLDENNVAVIPEAVMADKCKLSIGVFGTNANGDVKTSKILTYNIGKGAISNDLEATTPPEFWEQLLTRQINFENEIDSKVDTLETDVETLDAIAKGRNQALAYTSYSEMITALNGMSSDELMRGQNIYIGVVGVPDLWVYGVETDNVEYTYVDDETFVESLNRDVTVQVGYFKLAQLETQKVDVGGINSSIDNLENRVEALEKRGSGLKPYPVTGVTTDYLVFTEGVEKATLKINWTKPVIYDIQVDHYNIYGYVGDTAPTNISDFTLLKKLTYNNTSIAISVTEPYNYVLVSSVSVEGQEQENLSQMSTVDIRYVPAVGTTLENMSWKQINDISEVGLASTYFSVGDTKTMSISTENYKVAIYGFKKDDLADGSGKAGMTFGLVNCLSTKYPVNSGSSNSNTKGWSGCSARTLLRGTIYNGLEQELRNYMKNVSKKTSAGNKSTTINTSTDNLFLFSEIEVVGSISYSVSGEGSKYPIFTDEASRIKKLGDNGSANGWWLRSPHYNNTTTYVGIDSNGLNSAMAVGSASSFGICFGFCI